MLDLACNDAWNAAIRATNAQISKWRTYIEERFLFRDFRHEWWVEQLLRLFGLFEA